MIETMTKEYTLLIDVEGKIIKEYYYGMVDILDRILKLSKIGYVTIRVEEGHNH